VSRRGRADAIEALIALGLIVVGVGLRWGVALALIVLGAGLFAGVVLPYVLATTRPKGD
jgi:hypothetical protein